MEDGEAFVPVFSFSDGRNNFLLGEVWETSSQNSRRPPDVSVQFISIALFSNFMFIASKEVSGKIEQSVSCRSMDSEESISVIILSTITFSYHKKNRE